MRVIVFSEGFGFDTTTFIANQVAEMGKRTDLLYLCNNTEEETAPTFQIKKLDYNFYKWIDYFRLRLEWRDILLWLYHPSFAKKLKQTVEVFRPDLIHCQFGYDALRFLDNYFPKNIPVLINFRGFDASRKLQFKTYTNRIKKVLAKPNVYPVFVCKYLKENLENHGIPVRKEHLVLYSNTDTDFFKRKSYEHPKSRIKLVQVSSFREKKGHVYTLKALRRLIDLRPDLDVELTLTGQGGEGYDETIALIKKLDLDPHINLVGWVDKYQVRSLLEESHALLLHSITPESGDKEGIPNCLMEAMSMELPVLSTYHAGIPELVKDSVHGYLVEERDVVKYAERLEDIIQWGYQPQNRVRVQKYFSKERHIQELYSFYQQRVRDADREK